VAEALSRRWADVFLVEKNPKFGWPPVRGIAGDSFGDLLPKKFLEGETLRGGKPVDEGVLRAT